MIGVSASVNLPLHHEVQKFSLALAHPGGPGKRAIKRLFWWWWYSQIIKMVVRCTAKSVSEDAEVTY